MCQLHPVCSGNEELCPRPYYCVVPSMQCLLIHHLAYQDLLIYAKDLSETSQANSIDYQMKIDMEMSLNKVGCCILALDLRLYLYIWIK